MEAVFIRFFNVSMVAGWMIVAVLLMRLLLKKAPRWIYVLLWGIVALRLVMPFSFKSAFSIVPSVQTIQPLATERMKENGAVERGEVFNSKTGDIINSGNALIDRALTAALCLNKDHNAPNKVTKDATTGDYRNRIFFWGMVWLAGMGVLILYGLFGTLHVKRKVGASVALEGNVRLCDQVDTPFILGILRPNIFLPSGIEKQDREYVLAHEKAHLRRLDHLWKPLGYLLLCVYWFHPLIWVAYLIFCRDLEMACDEKVVSAMGMADKKAYANALVNCSLRQRLVLAYPLAFGEVAVKKRVRDILHYRKPTFWILLVSILSCLILALGFLTDPGLSLKTDASRVDRIEVFSGNTGRSLEVTDKGEIRKIVDCVNALRLQRGKWSFGYMGYGYRVTIHERNGKKIDFMVNSSDLLRKDPYFYHIEGESELYVYLGGLYDKQVVEIVSSYGDDDAYSADLLSEIKPVDEPAGSGFDASVWGKKLKNQYMDDTPYAVGRDGIITKAQVEARQYFYQVRGLNEEEALCAALQELMEEEAMYQKALSLGITVADEEVFAYLGKMKAILELSDDKVDNAGELLRIMDQFDSPEDYWEFEYSVTYREMIIQKYVNDLTEGFLKNHPFRSDSQQKEECREYLEQVKKDLVLEQDFRM